jgi:hypothetical protein
MALVDTQIQAGHLAGNMEDEDDYSSIFRISATSALRLLCKSVDRLSKSSTKSPLTPPSSPPRTPLSSPDLKDLDSPGCLIDTPLQNAEHSELARTPDDRSSDRGAYLDGSGRSLSDDSIQIEKRKQSETLAKKFYSKHAPPTPIDEYLFRMHRFCPLSPAVYLAVGLYLHRLIHIDKILIITPLNVHRLLLAALRVASKALEDLNYPNSRFAKVGGITEREMGRLEISFCFLMGFELKVDEKMLQDQLQDLVDGLRANESSRSG